MQISLHLRPPALGQETLPPPSSQSPGPGEYCITLEEHIQLLMFCLMSSPSLSWSLVFATTSVTREQKISMSNQLWGSFLTKQSETSWNSNCLSSHLTPCYQVEFSPWPNGQSVLLCLWSWPWKIKYDFFLMKSMLKTVTCCHLKARLPGFKVQFYHLLAVWP